MEGEWAKGRDHAFRRKDQISADKLLTKAASAMSIGGSMTNMGRDSFGPLFPICSFLAIGKFLSQAGASRMLKEIFTSVGYPRARANQRVARDEQQLRPDR